MLVQNKYNYAYVTKIKYFMSNKIVLNFTQQQ